MNRRGDTESGARVVHGHGDAKVRAHPRVRLARVPASVAEAASWGQMTGKHFDRGSGGFAGVAHLPGARLPQQGQDALHLNRLPGALAAGRRNAALVECRRDRPQ
jgi:hypothetical protein